MNSRRLNFAFKINGICHCCPPWPHIHVRARPPLQFFNDIALVDARSKYCKQAHFGQLFIAIDATHGKALDERFNRKKVLNRQEFTHCLVRAACMRYILPGELTDVSEAVHRLLSADIEPKLDTSIFVAANEFRTTCGLSQECCWLLLAVV